MKYPKKVIKEAWKKGFNWAATDNDGSVYLYKNRPNYCNANIEWSTGRIDCIKVAEINLWDTDWRATLYEIPPKPIYPKWVIKLAKHYGCKWIAANECGVVCGYSTKPEQLVDGWRGVGYLYLVSSEYPLNLSVDWTESLYEVGL